MTREEIERTVLRELGKVAPEAEFSAIAQDVPLRDQLDLDSLDFLRFIVGLHRALGVEVPEVDYPRLETLASSLDYLAHRLSSAPSAPA